MTYDDIISRLEKIEEALAELDQEDNHPAAEFFRAKWDYKFAWAQAYLKTEGTVAERENLTIIAMYPSDDYKRYVAAQARYEAHKARTTTLCERAKIGQSLLKASTREAPQVGEQPAWTNRGPAAGAVARY